MTAPADWLVYLLPAMRRGTGQEGQRTPDARRRPKAFTESFANAPKGPYMRENDPFDDPISGALLGDSAYDRLQVRRQGVFPQPVHTKLRWQSGLLFSLALVLPMMAALPAEVRPLLPEDGAATATAPMVVWPGLVGGTIVLLAGVTLIGLGLARVQLEPRMSDAQAAALLNMEEVASLFGFATGGLGILLTLVLTAVGLGGVEAIGLYEQSTGGSPFAPGGVAWLSVNHVAIFGFVGSVGLFTASQYIRMELMITIKQALSTA